MAGPGLGSFEPAFLASGAGAVQVQGPFAPLGADGAAAPLAAAAPHPRPPSAGGGFGGGGLGGGNGGPNRPPARPAQVASRIYCSSRF